MDIITVLLFFLVCTAGSALQAASGFGFVLFVMMFFPYILPSSQTGVVISGILAGTSSTYMTIRLFRSVRWGRIAVPVIAYLAVSTAVIIFSSYQPDTVIVRALGLCLVLLSFYFIFFGNRIKIRPTAAGGIISGSLSGILGGFFSVSGPPIVMYMISASEDKDVYMANIQAYFAITGTYSTIVRIAASMVTYEAVIWSAVGLAAVMIGIFIGRKLFVRLNIDIVKKIVYAVMALSGITMLLKK